MIKFKIKLVLLFIAIIGISGAVNAQDTIFARQALSQLCSPEFGGRGYVDNGDKIAAKYISKNFKQWGLKAFSDNYYQKFKFPINTINKVGDFVVNGNILTPATDYLIANASKSRSGKFKVQFVNDSLFVNDKNYHNNILKQDLSNVFLVFSDPVNKFRYNIKTKIGGLIFLHKEKVGYWHFGHAQLPVDYAIIDMVDSLLTSNVKEININFKSKFYPKYESQNVVGYVKGKLYPDSFIAITAHYDHMGKMGKEVYFPGANDNASGSVMMMNFAKYFASSNNQPDYSIVFIAFAGEEVGLLGSVHYARNPLFELNKIKILFNLDMVGTGSRGITVVNGSVIPEPINRLREINKKNNYLEKVKNRGESCNSDHCPFYKKGVPAYFIYTLGKEHIEYHTINDKAEVLPLTKYTELFSLLRDFIEESK